MAKTMEHKRGILLGLFEEWDDACKRAQRLSHDMGCKVYVDMHPQLELKPWVVWCDDTDANLRKAPKSSYHTMLVKEGGRWWETTAKGIAIVETSKLATVCETEFFTPDKTQN